MILEEEFSSIKEFSMKSVVAVFMALVLCLASVGCGNGTQSNLITALNAVADAASVAVVVVDGLAATGKISPADAALVATYVTSVGTATNQSITELNSTDTNSVKIGKITGYFAVVAAPALPPSIGPLIGPIISAVVTTIDLFIHQLNGPAVVTAAAAAPRAAIKLTGADKAALKSIQKKTAETTAKAAALKTAKK